MKENTIAIEPLHAWHRNTNPSKVAREWLIWLENELKWDCCNIMSAEEQKKHEDMALGYSDNPHPLHTARLQTLDQGGQYHFPSTRYTVDG